MAPKNDDLSNPQEISTQPPIIAIPTVPAPESLEAEEVRSLTHDANQNVKALLTKREVELASHAQDWLPTLLEKAIDFAAKDAQSHALLARYLQKANGRYGAYIGEEMSVAVQKKVIRNWIVFNLIGQPIDELIIQTIRNTPTGIRLRNIDLQHYLVQTTFADWNLSETLKSWIYRNVLSEEVPAMAYLEKDADTSEQDRELVANMHLDTFRWGYMHACLRLLRSAELDERLLPAAAVELGEILLVQLQESVAPIAWWDFFRLPAIIRYTRDLPDLASDSSGKISADLDAQALASYVRDIQRMTARRLPLEHFYNLLIHFHSRTELARKILYARCPPVQLSRTVKTRQHICNREITDSLLLPEGRSNKPALERILPPTDIDQKFREQNDAIADAYRLVDYTLLIAAFNTQEDDDLDYLNRAEVYWTKVFQASTNTTTVRADDERGQTGSNHPELLPHTHFSFFSACLPEHADRIYVLERKKNGYALNRVEDLPEQYTPYFPETISKADYVLQVTKQKELLKSSEQKLRHLLEHISNRHRQIFARNLHNYGLKQDITKRSGNALLSLIPFYNCASSIASGEIGVAALSCGIDVISLAPLIGQLSSISLRLAKAIGGGVLSEMRNAAMDVNLRNIVQTSIKQTPNDLIRYATAPATDVINRRTATSLGLATLRWLDPGIELAASIGTASLKQTIELGEKMALNEHRLDQVLEKIDTELQSLPIPQMQYVLARRAGIDRDIPVIQLTGDHYRDRPVYVQFDPVSGQAFGRKYVLTQDNELHPVPLETARHLQNILTQGIGGKGAVKQAQHWAVNTGELDAAMLQRLQQGVANGANLDTLARQYDIKPQWLHPYLSASGELTTRGEQMIAHAEQQRAQAARGTAALQPELELELDPDVTYPKPASTSAEASSFSAIRPATRTIIADADVRRSFMAHDGMISNQNGLVYLYNIDLDVFVERRFDTSNFVYIADNDNGEIIPLTMDEARQRASTISNNQRNTVLKALDIDLDITAILQRPPLITLPKRSIPKRISYVWIGDKEFKDDLLAILRSNCARANEHGFKVYFYLSEQSQALNYIRIKNAVCGNQGCLGSLLHENEVKILETTNFYSRFSASRNYQQYRDAIDGNGGIATNFASAADILRLAILKEKGGLYMDVDDVLTASFGEIKLQAADHGFVLAELLDSAMLDMHPEFGTSFFGTHPGNKVIDDILEEIERRYQLPENRDYYRIARPHRDDRIAMLAYVRKLSMMTGPKVFNEVLREKFPAIKEFMEMSKLEGLSYRPLSSELIQKLLKKTPTAEEITPLAGCSEIGSLHSWKEQRRKRDIARALLQRPPGAQQRRQWQVGPDEVDTIYRPAQLAYDSDENLSERKQIGSSAAISTPASDCA